MRGKNQYGEKLMCIRIPDYPWGENWVYTNFFPGENLVYTRFSGGKFDNIPIFPGGNSSMGEKLGCNTGT